MLSGTCVGETGIACTDEARDRVNVSMITLTTSISRLLMAFVFLVSLKNCGYPQLPEKQTGSNADASLFPGKFTKALSLPAVVTSAPKPIPDTYLARLTWVAIDPGRKIPRVPTALIELSPLNFHARIGDPTGLVSTWQAIRCISSVFHLSEHA